MECNCVWGLKWKLVPQPLEVGGKPTITIYPEKSNPAFPIYHVSRRLHCRVVAMSLAITELESDRIKFWLLFILVIEVAELFKARVRFLNKKGFHLSTFHQLHRVHLLLLPSYSRGDLTLTYEMSHNHIACKCFVPFPPIYSVNLDVTLLVCCELVISNQNIRWSDINLYFHGGRDV